MLSRVADSIYWLSRYVERADNVARFLDVNFNINLGNRKSLQQQWSPLVLTTGDETTFAELYDSPSQQHVLKFLAFDPGNPNSIVSCVRNARENARSIRDVIPVRVWEQLNKFYFFVQSAAQQADVREPSKFCDQVKLASHVIDGMMNSTMSRGDAWHFARLGRLLERAEKTSRIVDVQYYLLLPRPADVGTVLDVARWSALLKSASALEMYRQVHGRIVPTKVAEFLVLDRLFPRSVHYCVIHAQASLQAISGSLDGTFRYASEQRMGRLRAALDYATIEDVIDVGLHEFIDDFQLRLNQVGTGIQENFFTQPELGEPTTSRRHTSARQPKVATLMPSGVPSLSAVRN